MILLLWLSKIVHILRHGLRKWFYRRLGCTIGQNVRLFGNLDGVNPDKITIGDNTVIAKAVQIITHCPVRGNAPVRIGKNCYIGYGTIILPGVTVGDNCIVGAGSVVTRNIPPNIVAYGNPARARRHRNAAELERTVRQVETGQSVTHDQCNFRDRNQMCLKESWFGPHDRPCLALQGKPCTHHKLTPQTQTPP
jgi:carbonic anhydrase/acetyltransferase-like protein (isoleucine patch superfamily)